MCVAHDMRQTKIKKDEEEKNLLHYVSTIISYLSILRNIYYL